MSDKAWGFTLKTGARVGICVPSLDVCEMEILPVLVKLTEIGTTEGQTTAEYDV